MRLPARLSGILPLGIALAVAFGGCSGGGSAKPTPGTTAIPVAGTQSTATPFPTLTPSPLQSPTAVPIPTPTPGPNAQGTTTPQGPLTLTSFEDKTMGFAISYPETWDYSEGDITQGDVLFATQSPVTGGPHLLLDVFFPPELTPVEVQAKTLLTSLQTTTPSLKVLAEGPFTPNDGASGYAFSLEYTDASTSVGTRLVIVTSGSRVFEILGQATRSEYDGVLPDFDRMAKSFKAEPPTVFGANYGNAFTMRTYGPATLDPQQITDISSYSYVVQIFGGLVGLDKNLNVIPDLAESWTKSADGKTYTFTLRSNAKFHSGKTVAADDVKYSLERAAAPTTGSPTAALYLNDIVGVTDKLAGSSTDITGVKVLDPLHLQITLKDPVTYFLAKITHPVAFVVDKTNVESGPLWFAKPNGTGPFKLRGWDPGVAVVLDRNSDYYRTVPTISSALIWNYQPNPLAMYAAGEADAVDLSQLDSPDLKAALTPANPASSQLQTTDDLAVSYLGFNTKIAPFDDARARRAFLLASDIEPLIQKDMNGSVARAAGILPPGLPGYNPAIKPSYDPTQAKALWAQVLADKGASANTVKVMVVGATSLPAFEKDLAAQWTATLGVTVQFTGSTAADVGVSLVQTKANLFTFGWGADYPDPQNFLDLLFYSKSVNNFGAYTNADFDKLIEQARTEQDQAVRFTLYRQAETLLLQDGGAIPLWHDRSYYVISPKVKGWTYSAQQVADLVGITLTRPLLPAGASTSQA